MVSIRGQGSLLHDVDDNNNANGDTAVTFSASCSLAVATTTTGNQRITSERDSTIRSVCLLLFAVVELVAFGKVNQEQ